MAAPQWLPAAERRAISRPAHGGGCHEGGIRNPGPGSGAGSLAEDHGDAAQAVPRHRAGDRGSP